jgi:hypothetical protein
MPWECAVVDEAGGVGIADKERRVVGSRRASRWMSPHWALLARRPVVLRQVPGAEAGVADHTETVFWAHFQLVAKKLLCFVGV